MTWRGLREPEQTANRNPSRALVLIQGAGRSKSSRGQVGSCLGALLFIDELPSSHEIVMGAHLLLDQHMFEGCDAGYEFRQHHVQPLAYGV